MKRAEAHQGRAEGKIVDTKVIALKRRPNPMVNMYRAPNPSPGAFTESNTTEKPNITKSIRKWCNPMI